jgi:Fur family transcriptional regulator, ferric uptake regulator
MERDTRQRTAITNVVEASPRPLSALEVLAEAQAQVPGMGIATVYRNLKALTEAGRVVIVSIPGMNPRYESVKAGHHHHHHFMCTACGKVFDLHGCPGALLDAAPKGFTVERHELTLYGRCNDCPGEAAPVA